MSAVYILNKRGVNNIPLFISHVLLSQSSKLPTIFMRMREISDTDRNSVI